MAGELTEQLAVARPSANRYYLPRQESILTPASGAAFAQMVVCDPS